MPTVTRIIRQQHRAITSVLFTLRALTRQALRSGNRPDFHWLRMLAEYVERFPGGFTIPTRRPTCIACSCAASPRRPA